MGGKWSLGTAALHRKIGSAWHLKGESQMPYSLEEMADRLEINDTLIRYVHGLDDQQVDVLDTVFLQDCMFDLTSAGAMKAPWSEVKLFFAKMHLTHTRDMHFFGMSRITFRDAARTEADVRSKVINPMGALDKDGVERFFQIHGTYDDVFIRTPDGWRIRQRTWNMGWISGDCPYDSDVGAARMKIAEQAG